MERRACQRKIKKLTTLFITGNKEYQGITSDISCNGIFLRTSKNLQKGTTLDMKVEYNNASSMSLTGKVVREAFTSNNQGLGIQLINISPEYDDLVKELHPKIMANEWETIFNAIGQPAIILDADYKIIEANKATLTASGMSKKDFLGKKCHDIFHKTSEPPKMCPMSKAFQSREPETKTMELETLGGVYLVSCTPIFDKEGCLEKIIHIATDITERKKIEDALMESEKKLQVLSITDELTGLSNRRGFFTLAEQQLKQSIRDKKGIYLVLADVDYLKMINDNLGHHEGDVVLIKTANILKESFRESDIIARIGGDEFVILVNETPETSIDSITFRLKNNVKAYNNSKRKKCEISLSLGVAHCSHKDPCNLEKLIVEADKLMYAEKKQKH